MAKRHQTGGVSTEREYHAAGSSGRGVPSPECTADEEILFALGLLDPEHAARFWHSDPARYDWRAAQVASWSVPIGSCVRCRRTVHWACWRWRQSGHCPYGCDAALRRI